jgi:hypothetical protein
LVYSFLVVGVDFRESFLLVTFIAGICNINKIFKVKFFRLWQSLLSILFKQTCLFLAIFGHFWTYVHTRAGVRFCGPCNNSSLRSPPYGLAILTPRDFFLLRFVKFLYRKRNISLLVSLLWPPRRAHGALWLPKWGLAKGPQWNPNGDP